MRIVRLSFFFSSRRRHTRSLCDWSSDVCSSDLGVIENLSQSGVLLHGPQRLPDNTLIEMVFEMPEEISGQKNSTVLCQGRVIRSKDGQNGAESVGLAASILDYKFLRQN